jgi:adenylate kinase family enzyme
VERILVIGPGGAGKSHLSIELGGILGLPVIHLDRLLWGPGWADIPRGEWTGLVKQELSRPKWIIEGDYLETFDQCLAACDTVIFLSFSRITCFWRVLLRPLKHRHVPRPDVPDGCVEKLDLNLLKKIWRYPRSEAPQILERLRRLGPHQRVFILKSREAIASFLQSLRGPESEAPPGEFECASF